MGYEKSIDKEHFRIAIHSTDDGENFWMQISAKGRSASRIISYPNAIERFLGITPLQKLQDVKQELFKELRKSLQGGREEVISAIDEFCKENS